MCWYWVVLIVLSSSLVALLLGFIWARRGSFGQTETGRAVLAKEREELLARVRAEEEARQKIETAARTLAAERREIAKWYTANKEALDAKAAEEFQRLASNPAAVDRWLDDVLSADPPKSAPDEG